MSPRATAAAPRRSALRRHFSREPSLLTSLLLVFPLFLFYQLGVLFTPTLNGADLITRPLQGLMRHNLGAYLLLSGVLTIAFIVVALVLRRRQDFDWRLFVPVLLESAIYALTMGSLINLIMNPLARHLATGIANAGLFDRVIMSFGAGVHEELLFRLILLSGILAVLHRVLRFPRWLAVAIAFVISSLLFSLAHHVGPYGEPLQLGVFTYRFLAGLIFATLFYFRSFAIAVYTHALYDVYVMVLR
ncbi:MAG TPA: CPBP family intramembrane glutamic endopeptidase [Polyangia bacterium]|jgi:membrane protease YdiL (CAAX protease family)